MNFRLHYCIIPTFGHHDLTHQVIKDVHYRSLPIIVVDQKGDYKPYFREIVLRPGTNFGLGPKAVNFAVEYISFRRWPWETITILNNDVRLAKLFFIRLLSGFTFTRHVGLVGPYQPYIRNKLAWSTKLGQLDKPNGRGKFREVPSLDGCCLSFHRSLYDKIGSLDHEVFQGCLGEDLDYCIRARRAGFKVVESLGARLLHKVGTTAIGVYGSWQDYRRTVVPKGRHSLKLKYGFSSPKD
jgi:GT2 family glycosyltransferase